MYNRLTSGEIARNYYYGVRTKRFYRNLRMTKTFKGQIAINQKDMAAFQMVERAIQRTLEFEQSNRNSRRAQIV
jgi:aspartate ammonia-lyase